MPSRPRTVLITGCSAHSLGSALALALHDSGLHVIATARSASKLKHLSDAGITTQLMDVCDAASISRCVAAVTETLPSKRLDMLINNAGGTYAMPLVDADLDDARKLFDLNVWSCLAVTQAFLPLLVEAKGVVVNHTSVLGEVGLPFQGVYSASKAAAAIVSDTLRLELAPLGLRVVQLKSGATKSGFLENANGGQVPKLPKGSVYEGAREVVEAQMMGEAIAGRAMETEKWANEVARLLVKENPPRFVSKGYGASLMWFAKSYLPTFMTDGLLRDMVNMVKVEKALTHGKVG